MYTYVIGNLKGGVGKSTSTVNLSYSFSVLEKRVLVLDADPQGNTTPFFTKANQSGKTIWDAIENPDKVKSCIYRSRYSNIDIIKGDTGLCEEDVKDKDWFVRVKKLLQDDYDICVIDTRPVFENITTSVALGADVFLTPVYLDNYCRDNLALVEEFLLFLPEHVRPNWKIFANMVDARRKSQRKMYEDLLTRHDYPFMDTCINDAAAVENALGFYKPVMKHRSKSQVTQDYLELAKELLELEA